ncbi:MSMEG_1061 family FMN-dependent PPOX-type flavoprotein [Pseudoxanthobacter sp.]|uniref:MSMEG_1061 family FMN-dependent PPOX-type flavoprotein n=1 Tax=Pseudoxanthobacter sp. TaxID=1925742 RepID=UPI002FE1F45F
MARITDPAALHRLCGAPSAGAREKVLHRLDAHCRAVLAQARFCVIATAAADGLCDAAPRGGPAGMAIALDDTRLMLPDYPGNRRFETLTNLIARPGIGLLFLVPGWAGALRIRGTAEVRDDAELCDLYAATAKRPPAVIVIAVREAYIQFGKAAERAGLWSGPAAGADHGLPQAADMIRDHVAAGEPAARCVAAIDMAASGKPGGDR